MHAFLHSYRGLCNSVPGGQNNNHLGLVWVGGGKSGVTVHLTTLPKESQGEQCTYLCAHMYHIQLHSLLDEVHILCLHTQCEVDVLSYIISVYGETWLLPQTSLTCFLLACDKLFLQKFVFLCCLRIL